MYQWHNFRVASWTLTIFPPVIPSKIHVQDSLGESAGSQLLTPGDGGSGGTQDWVAAFRYLRKHFDQGDRPQPCSSRFWGLNGNFSLKPGGLNYRSTVCR